MSLSDSVDRERPWPPRRLYKYICREHGEKMTTAGEVRIGSLQAYRDIYESSSAPVRRDEKDGIIGVKGTIKGFSAGPEGADKHAQLKRVFIDAPGANVIIRDLDSDATSVSEPLYVYCGSDEYREDLVQLFCKDCGPDNEDTIVIDNPNAFFMALSFELGHLNFLYQPVSMFRRKRLNR